MGRVARARLYGATVMDLTAFLSDVSPDDPSGPNLEYDKAFQEMERAAEGSLEQQFGATIIAAEPPEWKNVKTAALGLLERTRDVRIAVLLARALLNTDGFQGFADGLTLTRDCWTDPGIRSTPSSIPPTTTTRRSA
jgi:type VI secretion system protein ImpA